MRRVFVLFGIALVAASIAAAQETPRFELYGGYMLVRGAPAGGADTFNSNGGVGALQFNLTNHLGVVAELGGASHGNLSSSGTAATISQSQFTYLFGPRIFVHRDRRFSPFAEFLIGGIHNSRDFKTPNSSFPGGLVPPPPPGITFKVTSTTTSFSTGQNAFSMALGGGVDIKLAQRIAVRPIQIDYLPSHFSPLNVDIPGVSTSGRWQQNLRYSAGITLRFGSR